MNDLYNDSSVDIKIQVELISELFFIYTIIVYLAGRKNIYTIALGVSLAVAVPVILVFIVLVVLQIR